MKNLHQEHSLGKSHRGFEKEDEEIAGDEKVSEDGKNSLRR